jgi:hypothetical protein
MYYFSASVIWRLAFYGLLRPKEMIGLRAGDCMFHRTAVGAMCWVLAVVDPKNRRAFGLSQFVVIKDAPTIAWVQWFTMGMHPDVKIRPSDRNRLLRTLRHLLDRLGIPHEMFSLAGFRPGRATQLYLDDIEIARLRYMGRWASESSHASYL